MEVSIVIRTRNEAEFIDKTLRKVREQEFTGKYEIIVVDSGSTDSTLDIIRRYNVRLLQIPYKEFTYGRSLNLGASNAKASLIVNLSAHALPRNERWLTHLIDGFEDDDVAAVYGRQLSIGHLNPFEACQNEVFFGNKRITFNPTNKTALKNIHFSNSNSAIRKDVWEKFRFDEEVPYAEDLVWQRQISEAGYSIVYVPYAVVYHTHRVSILNAYRNSRDCAYSLSMRNQKRQLTPLILYDAGIFLTLMVSALVQNVCYVWQKKYLKSMMIAPIYVFSAQFGWLVGRTKHRLKR